jgi:hypothetical protein
MIKKKEKKRGVIAHHLMTTKKPIAKSSYWNDTASWKFSFAKSL